MRRLLFLLGCTALLLGCGKESPTRSPNDENHIPVINRVYLKDDRILAAIETRAYCQAEDKDGQFIGYRWRTTGGYFPYGYKASSVVWRSPLYPGRDTLFVTVTDYTDSVTAPLVVDIMRVDPPQGLAFINGSGVVDLSWGVCPDNGAQGFTGYEVFAGPVSMIGMDDAAILPYRLPPGPVDRLDYRVAGLQIGNRIYCQIRSRRDYAGIVERSAAGPEIETAPRLDGFAADPISGEAAPLYEVACRYGSFGIGLPGGEIELLDPDRRDSVDVYLGTDGPEDHDGALMLKSPSFLAYRDPAWSDRVTGIWVLEGNWQTAAPPEDPPLAQQAAVELGAVYGLYTAGGHYAKLRVLEQGGVYPNRTVWLQWAWQPIPGYPRF